MLRAALILASIRAQTPPPASDPPGRDLSMLRPGRPHGRDAPTYTEAYASTDDRRGQKEVRTQQPKWAPDVLRARPHPGYHYQYHGDLREVQEGAKVE